MADYLPLMIQDVVERKSDDGEIRMTAICSTVQPETINLNLSRLDAQRYQTILQNRGKVLMIPIRRGEFSGRSFTSISDGLIMAVEVQARFELSQNNAVSISEMSSSNDAVVDVSDLSKTDKSSPSLFKTSK